MDYLNEICKHCGLTYESHHGGTQPWPRNYCPGSENAVDWENGGGTVFEGTGEYRKLKDGVPAKNAK